MILTDKTQGYLAGLGLISGVAWVLAGGFGASVAGAGFSILVVCDATACHIPLRRI